MNHPTAGYKCSHLSRSEGEIKMKQYLIFTLMITFLLGCNPKEDGTKADNSLLQKSKPELTKLITELEEEKNDLTTHINKTKEKLAEFKSSGKNGKYIEEELKFSKEDLVKLDKYILEVKEALKKKE